MDFKLTTQQEDAIRKTVAWYKSPKSMIWKIFGYSGVGKSSIVRYIMDDLAIHESRVAYMTFTGKASLVLRRKGIPANTIHSTIYQRKVWEENGQQVIVWSLRKSLDVDLIVIDEVSMVSDEIMNDIRSFGIPIIIIGDPAQLPPVNGVNQFMQNPDVMLSEIHRTAMDDPIVRISMKVRNGETISQRDSAENVLITSNQLSPEVLNRFDIVLAGTHKVRQWTNNSMRRHLGFTAPEFSAGEKVVFKANNKNHFISIDNMDVTICNGMIGYLRDGFDPTSVTTQMVYNEYEKKTYEIDTVDVDVRPEFSQVDHFNDVTICLDTLTNDNQKPITTSREISVLNRGYCITTHSCVTDDTYIFTDRGLMTLKEMNNDAPLKEFKKLQSGIRVYNGFSLETPSAFYDNGVSIGLNIKTKVNGNIRCSKEHRFKVIGEDGLLFDIEAKDLDIQKHQLLINLKNEVYGNITDLNLDDGFYCDVRTKLYKLPKVLDEKFSMFLGMMVADGTLFDTGFRLVKRHEDVVEKFSELVNDVFGYEGKVTKCLKHKNAHETTIHSKHIVKYISQIGGISPRDKYIPQCILQTTKKNQCAFLRGLFEDGTVNMKKNKFDHIELTFCTEKLIDQTRMLLLNMGIVTTKAHYDTQYCLYIYRESAVKFKNEIGFVSKFKNDRLLLNVQPEQTSNIQSFKHLPKIIDGLLKKYEIKYIPWIGYVIRKNRICRNSLKVFIDMFSDEMSDDDNFEYLKYVYEYFQPDNIVSMTEEEIHTYSIEMPMTHTFIQNGYLGKNSQGSEWDKVAVLDDFQWKPELHSPWLYTAITRARTKLVIQI